MKTSKLTLDQLGSELVVVENENLKKFKGGVDGSGDQYEYAVDPNGELYWRYAGSETWVHWTNMESVVITPQQTDYIQPTWFDFGAASHLSFPPLGEGGGSTGGNAGGTLTSIPNNINVSMQTEVFGPLTVTTYTIPSGEGYNWLGNMDQISKATSLLVGATQYLPYAASQAYALATYLMDTGWTDMQSAIANSNYTGPLYVEMMQTLATPTGLVNTQFLIRTADGTVLGRSTMQ